MRNDSPGTATMWKRRVGSYSVALAAVGIAVLFRWLSDPVLGAQFPLVTLFGAVAVAAWVGGMGPATATMLLGYALCQYLFVEPRGHLSIRTARDFLGLVSYLFTCSFIILMGEAFRVYRLRFEEFERQQASFPSRLPSTGYIRSRHTLWDPQLLFFAVALSVLVLGGVIGYQNARRIQTNAANVSRTHRTISHVNEALSTLKDMETGQRGFLLTGDSSYLAPYAAGTTHIQGVIDSLRPLATDPSQRERFDRLRRLVDSKLSEMAQTTALEGAGLHRQAVAVVQGDAGQRLMEQIRTTVGEMEAHEAATLATRSQETAEGYQITVLTITVSAILGVLLVIGLFLVTERRLRERQVAAALVNDQRERLRVTLSSIGDGVITTDLEGKVTSLNPVAEQLTGWTDREAAGQDLHVVFRIVNEDSGEPVENPALRALQHGTVVGLANHTLLLGRDGVARPIDDSAAPIRGADGKVAGCVLTFHDVTARRKLERERAAQAAATALAASLVDSSEDAIIAVSLDGRIQTWNAAAERLYRYTAEEAIGRPIDMLIPADRTDEERRLVGRLLGGERISHYDTVRQRKDGSLVEVSLTISAVRDEQGRVIGTSKIVRDNSQAKAAEARILGLMADLKEGDRRKDDFLAILAHELRNPLAPLRNLLEILKRTGGDRALLHETTATMDRQLDQIVRLVDDLLDVSRITRNKLQLRLERVDLGALLRQAVDMTRPTAEALHHRIELTLPEEPLTLSGDAVRLTQIFGNLLQNACKYTEPGGLVRVEAERQGSEARIAVIDNGVGIPADLLPRIFDLFTQVDQTLERSQGGLGIGLTLVKQLVTMHEGTVEARSDGPGCGSEFVVRLPLLVGSQHFTSTDVGPAQAEVVQPRRILVVDDNQDSAESLAILLGMSGHETHVAHDGVEAVEAAERLRPEVVLLDIGLPRLNGFEACSRMRATPWGRSALIVALSGWGQQSDRERSDAAGFNYHLVKPVDLGRLTRILATLPTTQGTES